MNFAYWDTRWFHNINDLAGRSMGLDRLLVFANKYGLYFFALTVIIYFFVHRRIFWAAFWAAILSRGIFTEVIRFFYHRARPFGVLTNYHLLVPKETEYSFPSGHAAFYFAIAFAVYLYDKKAGGWLLVLALILSLDRVFVGVHYPLDVLGGIIVGAISVCIVKKFGSRKKVIS